MTSLKLSHVMIPSVVAAYVISRRYQYPHITTTIASILVSSLVYVIFWLSWLYPCYFSELRHIPTVPGSPLWGQFFTIINEECGVPQRRWHEQHGPIIRYFFPFGAERLSIADNDALKHIMLHNPYNYPKPTRARLWMARILGEGVLLAEGQEHIHQRKTLAPGFSLSSIRALAPVFWDKSLLLSTCWDTEMRIAGNVKKHNFEVLEWLNRTTLDIIGLAGFGYDINSLENSETPIREAYRLVFAFDFFSRALHGLQAFIPSTKYLPAKMNRDMNQARHIILQKATDIIQEKQLEAEQELGGRDIMALIARENKRLLAAGQRGLSFETMRDQIMTFLGAGHDTTATGVAWTLHLLSVNPDIQNQLRDEIRGKFPFLFDEDSRFDAEQHAMADPDQLPFLDNVCRESLRFIPPIPMTVRQSLKDDTVGGYRIPGGTVVYVLANTINRLPMYWGNEANKFDPGRWDNLPKTFTNYAFMTFLHGPRGCIGRKFAETEMKVLLCCLLSKYNFERDESTDDPEMWKMWRLVLRPKNGVSLKVSRI